MNAIVDQQKQNKTMWDHAVEMIATDIIEGQESYGHYRARDYERNLGVCYKKLIIAAHKRAAQLRIKG